jgi:membrane protease subunit HflK
MNFSVAILGFALTEAIALFALMMGFLILFAAEGYYEKRVNEAEGDAKLFNQVFAEYIKAPEVTQQRLLLETLSEVLPNAKNVMLVDADLKGMLPLLNLSPNQPQVK